MISFIVNESFSLLNIIITFPNSKVMSSNCLFYPTNSPQPKNIQFSIKYDKEKHHIFTFEKLEPEKVRHFCFQYK